MTPPNPWQLARAVWPGAFIDPYQDEQIEAGRGDWPLLATCWRPPRAWRVWLRPLVLHPLPSLRWRYTDEAPTAHTPKGPSLLRPEGHPYARRRAERTHAQARELGYRYFVPVFPASAFGEHLPEVWDVVLRRRYPPSVDGLARLVEAGVVPAPRAGSKGADALAKHGRREARIAAKYPDGLPLFGGGR